MAKKRKKKHWTSGLSKESKKEINEARIKARGGTVKQEIKARKKTGRSYYEQRHWRGINYKEDKSPRVKSEYVNEQSMFVGKGD